MFRKVFFFLLIFSAHLVSAQNDIKAEQILTDLLNNAKTSAIKTSFTLNINEKNDSQPQTTKGTFTLKGSKFILEMDAMKSWFDGKTQWSYVAQNNEVSITEPTEKELAETNPMSILLSFKAKSTIRFSKFKSESNFCLEMIPKIKNNEISKIDVQVNKATGNLFLIRIINKNGGNSTLTLNNFQKGLTVNDNNFIFNSAKYKGVTINDLR